MFKGIKKENFVYFHHTDTVVWIPAYPENIDDQNRATISQSYPLGSSAPRFSWSGSGPRQSTIAIKTHRELWRILNPIDEDVVDIFDKSIEAICLPSYDSALKMINPPQVTVVIGQQLTITGVVLGTISKRYSGQWKDGKQMEINYSFTVAETEPQDAKGVMLVGSYRGISTTLERRLNG